MAVAVASIPYFPADRHASEFLEELVRKTTTEANVPEGFPKQLNSPLSWSAADINARLEDFVVNLDADEVAAIEAALEHFNGLSLPYSAISPDTFPLPEALSLRLKKVSNECYNGAGFSVVSGLDPDKYTAADNVAIYAGLASHVGPKRGFVDRKRESVISHLVNAGKSQTASGFTPAYTNGKVAFHSDNSEIMGLYAMETAEEGGRIRISSSFKLYNDLADNRPDILHTLSDEWVLDTFKDYALYPPIRTPYLHRAGPDKVIFRFSRYPMTGFNGVQRNPSLPAPTKDQIEALDAVQFMASANSVVLPITKGSIAFINDMAILHCREPFCEESPEVHRHLLKMFIRDPEQAWPILPTAKPHWERIYGPNREDGSRTEDWWIYFEQGQEAESPTNG